MITQRELLYFADPMCSWCWGFTPVLEQVLAILPSNVGARIFVGGLAIGIKQPLSEQGKREILGHWQQVSKVSDQKFDYAFFERDGFVYNSELPSYATVAVRNANLDAFYFFKALQQAFYQTNRDITREDVLCEIAFSTGLDTVSFREKLSSTETMEDAHKDFELTKKLGIQGFPTLLGMANNEIQLLAQGYQSFDVLENPTRGWLAESARKAEKSVTSP